MCSSSLNTSKFAFPLHGASESEVARDVAELCARDHDYLDGTIFNSICTKPLELAARIQAQYAESNIADNRIFPGASEAEQRVVVMLGGLLGSCNVQGAIVSGGTEANLLACAAALKNFRRTRSTTRRPHVLAPESIHFSFDKIAELLNFSLVRTPIDRHFRADIAELRRAITSDTALLVVTAGTSECGAVDDVESAAEIATLADLPLHVDAATGGFLIPFARELGYRLPQFDFSLDGVSSITIDPHKYGFVPPPAGCLLIRDDGPLRGFEFESHYVGTHHHKSLLGTRPGASALAVYAALRQLGWNGYREIVARLFADRDEFVQALLERGFDKAYDPQLTIIGIQHPQPEVVLANLEARGLIASVSRRYRFLRVVVQRHLSQEHYRHFLASLSECRLEAGVL